MWFWRCLMAVHTMPSNGMHQVPCDDFWKNFWHRGRDTDNFCGCLAQAWTVHPATLLYMSSVRKSTVLTGQRALRHMWDFCICCCKNMSRMTQPSSKMTSEIPQRCAKSSSENDAFSTPFEKYVAPFPLRSLGANHCKVGFCPMWFWRCLMAVHTMPSNGMHQVPCDDFWKNFWHRGRDTDNFCGCLAQAWTVHPATLLYMSSVRKSTVLTGQRALRHMWDFCICCCKNMSRMTQPSSKMTSEIPQRCAKSSSENDAIIFNTFWEICCRCAKSSSENEAIIFNTFWEICCPLPP